MTHRDPKPENLEILDVSDDEPLVQRAMVRFAVRLAQVEHAEQLRRKRPARFVRNFRSLGPTLGR